MKLKISKLRKLFRSDHSLLKDFHKRNEKGFNSSATRRVSIQEI